MLKDEIKKYSIKKNNSIPKLTYQTCDLCYEN